MLSSDEDYSLYGDDLGTKPNSNNDMEDPQYVSGVLQEVKGKEQRK